MSAAATIIGAIPQVVLSLVIIAIALGAVCMLLTKPWTEPYTPDRPERHGDLGTLDHHAGKHERTTP